MIDDDYDERPWTHKEKDHVFVIRRLIAHLERRIMDRMAEGKAANFEKRECAALTWALDELGADAVPLKRPPVGPECEEA